jgi:hypothetical protein
MIGEIDKNKPKEWFTPKTKPESKLYNMKGFSEAK